MNAHVFTLARLCRYVSAAFFLFFIVQTAPSFAMDLNRKIDFDVPPQALASAAILFSKQADIQFLVSGQKLDGVSSKGVRGSHAVDEGLKALLEGTGFGFKVVGEKTIALTLSNSAVVTGTEVQSAQASGPADIAPNATLQQVVVTGSHIRGVDSLSPMITITAQEMIDQGYNRLDQVFEQLPMNFKGGASQESNPTSGHGGDASTNLTFASGVNLRGLGAGTTLVLLNGRRLAPTARGFVVDISSIPVSIIDRVEILTDGASAIYGSDAIGGVVNIVTKRDFTGLETGVRAARISQGKQPDLGGNVLGGFDWGSGNLLVNIDTEVDKPLLAKNRPLEANVPDPLYLLQKLDSTSIYAAVRQEVTSQLTASVDLLSSNRNYQNQAVFSFSPFSAAGWANQLATNAELKYAISPNWSATAVFQESQEKDYNALAYPAIKSFVNESLKYNTPSFDAHIDGKLLDLPGGAMRMALGLQDRQESLATQGTTQTSGSRSVQSVYGEFFVPIVGRQNALPLAQQLVLDFAVRNDSYSDFGTTTNPKVALKWAPTQDLNLRASYATSFRAPLLQELGKGDLSTMGYVYSVPSPNAPGGMATVLLLDGTNANLRPERAKSYNAGFTFKPSFLNGLSLDVSYFSIDYKDRILRLYTNGFFSNVITSASALGPLVNLSPTLAQINAALAGQATIYNYTGVPYTAADIKAIANIGYNNVGSSNVHGLDFNLRYERDLNVGHAYADFTSTLYTINDEQITPTTAQFSALNQINQPLRFRAKSNLGWRSGAWTAYGRVNYANSYNNDMDPNCAAGKGLAGPGCRISSWTTFDLGFSYTAPKSAGMAWAGGWRAAFDVANVFNRAPPFANYPAGSSLVSYDPLNANPLQRAFAVTVTKKW